MTANSTSPCYKWGGGLADWVYTPCNPSAAYSMCCRAFEVDNDPADYCLPNGLCSNFGAQVSDLDSQTYWIESCSDPSWSDPACATLGNYIQHCYRDENGNAPLGFCSETTTYCCNRNVDNTTCCNTSDSENVILNISVASMVAVTTSFSGSVYTTALPTLVASTTTSSRAASSSSSSSTPQSGNQLSAGAGVGIGIAAALGVVLLALLLGYIFWRRSRGKRTTSPHGVNTGAEVTEPGLVVGKGQLSKPAEMEDSARYELQP